MTVELLEITNVRNITDARIQLSPRLNLVTGYNASGKTSLLEAIAVLLQGKSFRTPRLDQLLTHGTEELLIFGTYRQDQHIFKTGIRRSNKNTQVKVNGNTVNRTTDLVGNLPLFILTPESHELLASGPKVRRQFLDWGVFHVEHRYLDIWQSFHRVLRQRNSSLRQHSVKAVISAWDGPLAELADKIDQLRCGYINVLCSKFEHFCHDLLGIDVKLQYRAGWDKEIGLQQGLKDTFEQDLERGYTHLGPQRADLRFTSAGTSVQSIFSRGQQKLLICALVLSQIAGLQKEAIVLVDDLPAELDPHKRFILMNALYNTGKQVVVTATESNLVKLDAWPEKKLFHVEHGQIQEVV